MVKPGDVVTVDFPGAQGLKRRPAVVVSTHAYNAARPDVVLAYQRLKRHQSLRPGL